jgi:hypothetical protein
MSAIDSFGFKMIAYGDNLTDVNRKATIAAALVYKTGVLTSAASFLGSDLRFSVWKKPPAYGPSPRFGAGFEVGGSKVHANALLKARPLGMWRLLESGTREAAHPIKLRKKQGKKVLSRNGQIFGTTATVRGMRGQRSWSNGIRSSQAGAMQAYKRTQKLALLEAARR